MEEEQTIIIPADNLATIETVTPIATSTTLTTSPASNALLQKLLGGSTPTVTFADYAGWANRAAADGKVSNSELKEGQKLFGWTKNLRKAIGADLNGTGNGAALKRARNGLLRRYYVSKGKLISEGDTGITPEDFETGYNEAYYKGTDANELTSKYNTDVTNWRKNAKIVYVPGANGLAAKYIASGKFGNEDRNNIDITNSDWFKNDTDRQKSIQELAYYDAVNNYDLGVLSSYSALGLPRILGFKSGALTNYRKWDKATLEKARTDATTALLSYLDKLRANTSGNYNFLGNVKADAIIRYLKSHPIEWLNAIELDPEGVYEKVRTSSLQTGNYNYLVAKNGAVLKYIKKHKLYNNGKN